MQNITSDKLPDEAEQYEAVLPDYLQLHDRYGLKDLLLFVIMAILSSQLVYHGVCGFLQWYYYTLQRDNPHKWKCQPHRFLTRENEIHEILVGTTNMTLTSVGSGFLSCWIANGNYSSVYFKLDEYGYLYLVLSIPLLFLWVEATAYYAHKLLHVPWFYKNFHKQHHRYHSPTAYSLVAMSPFEMVFFQSYLIVPLFTAPINAMVFISVLMYVYYFGMIDHSGIKMKSIFPWQPDTMFHDDHHSCVHTVCDRAVRRSLVVKQPLGTQWLFHTQRPSNFLTQSHQGWKVSWCETTIGYTPRDQCLFHTEIPSNHDGPV